MPLKDKKDIKDFTLEELKKELSLLKEPTYRAEQLFFWLYKKGVSCFKEMKNLPKSLINRLAKLYDIGFLSLERSVKSKDKTEKFLFKLKDGNFIESILIPTPKRNTLCISTQVGCKFRCAFCASGLMGFKRDISPSEIAGQILFLQHTLNHKITNCVFMGMGEPLDNYLNTSKAIVIINSPEGLNIGARRITVSTCGIVPGINKLSNLKLQVNLSISLHAVDNELRNKLIPANRIYPLEKLLEACKRYLEKTGRLITLEYILIKGENNTYKDADRLADIAKELKAKVNLIAYNEVPAFNFKSPNNKDITSFLNRLKVKKVSAILRRSRGSDIQAACGQLAGKKNA